MFTTMIDGRGMKLPMDIAIRWGKALMDNFFTRFENQQVCKSQDTLQKTVKILTGNFNSQF
jgi:hypothetical protein